MTEIDTTEIWTPIKNFESLYAISSQGRVRSEPRHVRRGRNGLWLKPAAILKPTPNADGYPMVHLYGLDGKATPVYVHKLMADSFLGGVPKGLQVRHLDDQKHRNILGNLAIGTNSENKYDQVRNGIHPWAKRTACSRNHPYTPETTRRYRNAPGTRVCLACRRERRLEAAA